MEEAHETQNLGDKVLWKKATKLRIWEIKPTKLRIWEIKSCGRSPRNLEFGRYSPVEEATKLSIGG